MSTAIDLSMTGHEFATAEELAAATYEAEEFGTTVEVQLQRARLKANEDEASRAFTAYVNWHGHDIRSERYAALEAASRRARAAYTAFCGDPANQARP